jgi:hypothetical protein
MAALLNNMASYLEQLQKPGKKKPTTPTAVPGTLGYKPPLARPRGTLLTDVNAPVQTRKTLLGS